jgi:hypothetical protein
MATMTCSHISGCSRPAIRGFGLCEDHLRAAQAVLEAERRARDTARALRPKRYAGA